MVPKGRLIMIRNTDNPVPEKDKETNGSFFLHEIFQILSSSKDASIELITTASDQEKQVEKKYAEGLIAAGYPNFNFLYLSKEQNDDEQLSSRLSRAQIVIFTDEHSEICGILKESTILKLLYRKYLLEEHFTIVGINVGAMCISGIFMNDSGVIDGLGFINTCIIDTRFDHKTRFKNLIKNVILNNEYFGLGLSENTALIIEEGSKAICKGSGSVMLVNARNVKKFNPKDFDKGKTMFVKNLKGHILVDGCTLNLKNGEVLNTVHKELTAK
ncbi:Type 1 glutamine amidotransferase-like domain-containing protein [Chryseobacterium takakiae]|uniref:Cyanophycinase n=1 Tax=Chryseobacterium takakiae TaxID=1302685 RepID=A0A1M4TC37_9FLAO|nr:Type 1 glutamine amidotransferase-like domain-containing protein [Chryseobacterium takakiae]SHE42036.1 cyanophycinase [Chryseobacterium takakiae]